MACNGGRPTSGVTFTKFITLPSCSILGLFAFLKAFSCQQKVMLASHAALATGLLTTMATVTLMAAQPSPLPSVVDTASGKILFIDDDIIGEPIVRDGERLLHQHHDSIDTFSTKCQN